MPLRASALAVPLGAGLGAVACRSYRRGPGALDCEAHGAGAAAPRPVDKAEKQVVFLVRHGESEAQRRKLIGQAGDWPLTEEGEEQARRVGRFHAAALREAAAGGRVVASSQRRAVQTALAALEGAGLPAEAAARAVRACDGLREVHRGRLDGQSLAEAAALARWQELWAAAPPAERGGQLRFRVCEGAESYEELQDRASGAVEELLASLPGEEGGGPLWVFSHSCTIRALVWRALRVPAGAHPLNIGNCSVTVMERSVCPTSTWRVVEMNDTRHMHAVAASAAAY
uniref:Phosphoglycerate mutase n=1 Tax=Alexandrium monilatum TaxID=311494 RepID=A0A7S4VJ75_9DINO